MGYPARPSRRCLSIALFLLVCAWMRPSIAQPTQMSFVDFQLDWDTLRGSEVQVSGWLITVGDTFMFYDKAGSMNGIISDSSSLSTAEKRYLISHCGSGCNVTVVGAPATVMMNKGITLKKIVKPKIDAEPTSTGSSSSSSGDGQSVAKVTVPDYIVDYDSLRGKQVKLKGFLLSMGDTVIMYESLGSMNSVFIDTSGMSRDDRKYIMTNCSSGCNITLVGTPGDVMMSKGLMATQIAK